MRCVVLTPIPDSEPAAAALLRSHGNVVAVCSPEGWNLLSLRRDPSCDLLVIDDLAGRESLLQTIDARAHYNIHPRCVWLWDQSEQPENGDEEIEHDLHGDADRSWTLFHGGWSTLESWLGYLEEWSHPQNDDDVHEAPASLLAYEWS